MPQEPQIIDLDDPDRAPRTMAFILLACGLLGVGFMLVNVIFTGDDQYYVESEWEAGEEPVNTRFDILPNLVRTRQFDDEDEEAEDVPLVKPLNKRNKPTTGPANALQSRQPTGVTPTTPTTPSPGTPAPGAGTPARPS